MDFIIINYLLQHFAQTSGSVYGDGAYGVDVYQASDSQQESVVQETQGSQTPETVGAPGTGIISSGPEILIPIILGVSIVIATLVFAGRKYLNKVRNK